jgi:hypothetical protein
MPLAQAFDVVGTQFLPEDFQRFRQQVDPAWVEEALLATGSASIRRRRLPAELVVWLVVGMALLRNEAMLRVAALLGLVADDGDLPAKSGLTQARQRLGPEPMAYLFATTAERWAHGEATRHRWRGLALYGMDGTTLRVPDTPENWAAFGGQVGNGSRGGSAYPTVRAVAVMGLRSHLLASFRFDAYAVGEVTLAEGYWNEVTDDSLTLVDRNFLVVRDLVRLERSGSNRHWMTRAKSTTRLRTLRKLGPHDRLVEVMLSDATRRAHPGLPDVFQARAIRYQRRGFRPSTLLTSLLDPVRYPASELVEVYHQRWEIELGYDEVKTHLLDRQEAIRSRTPEGVRQELWGIALAYNLIRLEMARAAEEAGVEPTAISFVAAVSLIRATLIALAMPPMVPSKIPGDLLRLRQNLKLLILPPRRSGRQYPREVKIKMSNYLHKKSRRAARK